jgi:hypothetical protein
MTNLVQRRRRGRSGATREQKAKLRGWLARHVEAKVDLRRLDEADLERLLALQRDRADLRRLRGKDRDRLEAIVEKGAGLPAGHFRRLREEELQRREFARLAAEARRPPRKPALLPAGSIVLDADLGEDLRDGLIWLSHLTVIAALMFQFETGRAWAPGARFEGADQTGDLALHVDANMGVFGQARGEDHAAGNWKLLLVELEERGWFSVERRGKNWTIRRGPRALVAGKAGRA